MWLEGINLPFWSNEAGEQAREVSDVSTDIHSDHSRPQRPLYDQRRTGFVEAGEISVVVWLLGREFEPLHA